MRLKQTDLRQHKGHDRIFGKALEVWASPSLLLVALERLRSQASLMLSGCDFFVRCHCSYVWGCHDGWYAPFAPYS
jgi:hypothetical protein